MKIINYLIVKAGSKDMIRKTWRDLKNYVSLEVIPKKIKKKFLLLTICNLVRWQKLYRHY